MVCNTIQMAENRIIYIDPYGCQWSQGVKKEPSICKKTEILYLHIRKNIHMKN